MSTRRTFLVERKDIHYLRTTIESYDGMAVLRTVDPQVALIELFISPGCTGQVSELLESLIEHEGIMIDEK